MTRSEVLQTAEKMVCGHREQDYGSPEDSFRKIAALWSAYTGTTFTALDVASMMALLKLARIQTGTATDDSFVDLAGYAACGGEIASENKIKGTENGTLSALVDFINDELACAKTNTKIDLNELLTNRFAMNGRLWLTEIIVFFDMSNNLVIDDPAFNMKDWYWPSADFVDVDYEEHNILKFHLPINIKETK